MSLALLKINANGCASDPFSAIHNVHVQAAFTTSRLICEKIGEKRKELRGWRGGNEQMRQNFTLKTYYMEDRNKFAICAIFINDGHAKKQWDGVHASEAHEALLHCFPLFSCLISLACMHLVPLYYACPPFMNMVYRYSLRGFTINNCLNLQYAFTILLRLRYTFLWYGVSFHWYQWGQCRLIFFFSAPPPSPPRFKQTKFLKYVVILKKNLTFTCSFV